MIIRVILGTFTFISAYVNQNCQFKKPVKILDESMADRDELEGENNDKTRSY